MSTVKFGRLWRLVAHGVVHTGLSDAGIGHCFVRQSIGLSDVIVGHCIGLGWLIRPALALAGSSIVCSSELPVDICLLASTVSFDGVPDIVTVSVVAVLVFRTLRWLCRSCVCC